MLGVWRFDLKAYSVSVYLSVCSSPSRAISAAEASRWGRVEDLLLLAGTGPLPGSLCLQEIQPVSQWPYPMVSALGSWNNNKKEKNIQTALSCFGFHIYKMADHWNCVCAVFCFLGSVYTWRCLNTHVPWCILNQAGFTKSAPRSTNTRTPGRRASNSWSVVLQFLWKLNGSKPYSVFLLSFIFSCSFIWHDFSMVTGILFVYCNAKPCGLTLGCL